MTMKNAVFWDVTPCGSCKNRRFRGTITISELRLLVTANVPSSLMMEPIRSSETSVLTRATLRHSPEDGILDYHRCRKSHVWALAFLRCVYQICLINLSNFHLFGFCNIRFLRARSSALVPMSSLQHQVPVFGSPSDRLAQLYPQAPSSPFASFHDSQATTLQVFYMSAKLGLTNKTNSVALSPQANYTDWATATCWRNLVPTFADRRMSRGQGGGSPAVVNLSVLDRSRYFSFK
jgi:hypothetical protein